MSPFPIAGMRAAASSPEPLYFASGSRFLFGWLDRPVVDAARTGIIICAPFGYEAICSHRSMRALAQAAAAQGVPTLRFDYSGTGDSDEVESNSDQLRLWCEDISSAMAELRRRTGVEKICLLGVRLGALLALAVAECNSLVDRLILVAPVLNGSRYLRELRLTRLAAGALLNKPVREEADGTQSTGVGDLEVSGFTLYAATLQSLGTTDFALPKKTSVREVLLLDEASLPRSGAWQKIQLQGTKVAYLTIPGLFKMVMTPPHFSNVPQAMVETVRDWLSKQEFGKRFPSGNGDAATSAGAAAAAAPTLTLSADQDSNPIIERAVFLGSGPALFAIVTEPARNNVLGRAVLLFNQGANHHIGGSRIYVSLARRWASRGYVVLRLDFAGIGDSDTALGGTDDDVFPPTAMENIRTAVDFVRSTYSITHLTLGGLCSGGYHALRAAVVGMPVDRILLINPQNYFWKKGMVINETHLAQVMRNPAVYYKRVFSLRVIKNLFAGQLDLSRIIRMYINSLVPVEPTLRDLARRLGVRLQQDLGRELEEIVARGVHVVFIFARDEAGIELLKLQAGLSLERLRGRCTIHIVDRADHAFSHAASRAVMERILTTELFA